VRCAVRLVGRLMAQPVKGTYSQLGKEHHRTGTTLVVAVRMHNAAAEQILREGIVAWATYQQLIELQLGDPSLWGYSFGAAAPAFTPATGPRVTQRPHPTTAVAPAAPPPRTYGPGSIILPPPPPPPAYPKGFPPRPAQRTRFQNSLTPVTGVKLSNPVGFA